MNHHQLKLLRRHLGLKTKRSLAELLEVPILWIERWEDGTRGIPDWLHTYLHVVEERYIALGLLDRRLDLDAISSVVSVSGRSKGGHARAKALSYEQRKASAIKAARVRWDNNKIDTAA